MGDKSEQNSTQEISWRLKELGPELRRALFEKALHPFGPLSVRQPRARAQNKPGDPEVEPKKAGRKTGGA